MSKPEKVIRQGFVANTNAEGRLKGWDDESIEINGSEPVQLVHASSTQKGLNNFQNNLFGLVDQIEDAKADLDEQAPVEPMANMIRRRRSTSLTFFKGILGL
jgi:hypothetical protein